MSFFFGRFRLRIICAIKMVVQVIKIEHLTRELAGAETNSSADSSGIYIGVH